MSETEPSPKEPTNHVDVPPPSSSDASNAANNNNNNNNNPGNSHDAESSSPVTHLMTLTKHEGGVNCLRFSPDGLSLATAGDRGSVIVWSVPVSKRGGGNGRHYWGMATREEDLQVRVLRGQCEDVFDMAWSPCGRR